MSIVAVKIVAVKVAGLILAGGKSQRMGQPKALLPLRGVSFLETLIGTMTARCAPVIVVLGHEPGTIQAGLAGTSQARFVVNQDYESGQLTSLQCGLRALPQDIDAFAFTPVDYPAFSAATVESLCRALTPARLLVVPRHNGKRGHPVVAQASLIAEFLAVGVEGSAREVIHRHRDRTHYVNVDDPGILQDIDTPAAYEELLRSYA